MRLPYVDPNNLTTPSDQSILSRVKARRGPKGLIPLDLTLLHAPAIADGWNSLLGAIRTQTSLQPNIREIAICRPALINEAWFEWTHHLPLLLESESFQADSTKIEVVRELHPTGQGSLSEEEWVVLRVADAMTRDVRIEEALFGELKGLFSETEVVEIVSTVATYNLVSRFLVALDVGEQNGKKSEVETKVVNPTETDGRIQS